MSKKRRSVIEVTRFDLHGGPGEQEMFSVAARWSTSLDPDGGELVELSMEAELPADMSLTFDELEQRALAQIIRSAELLASQTPASLAARLRSQPISIVSSRE